MQRVPASEPFWRFCAERGVISKKLLLQQGPSAVVPLTLVADETIRYGAPIITVPYSAVVNAQTTRGGRQVPSLPTYSKTVRFLTRRSRMSRMAAEQVWLSAFVAAYKKMVTTGGSLPLAPLFSPALQPELPCLFTATNARECPALGAHPQAVLDEWRSVVQNQLAAMSAVTRFFQESRKRRASPHDVSLSTADIEMAHRTVMQRALLLPVNCEVSAPSSLPEFLERAPECPLLPSFVPVVDIIRAAAGQEQENCLLYTCAKSDFVSPSTRRRVLTETSPLSSRRVVVVATRDIKSGEELLLGVEW